MPRARITAARGPPRPAAAPSCLHGAGAARGAVAARALGCGEGQHPEEGACMLSLQQKVRDVQLPKAPRRSS